MQENLILACIYIFGLAFGVLCAFTITIIWMLFASSFLEFIYEIFSKKNTDIQPSELHKALKNDNAQAVILSDLHVDRWDVHDSNLQTLEDLMNLLKKHPHIEECVINGDLADFPEKETSTILERELGLLDIHESKETILVSSCIAILSSANIPLSVVLGNHDLSLHGLRNPHTTSTILPGNIKQIWDGVLILKAKNKRSISIEHGHRYDPLLTLYTSYRTMDIARNSQIDQASDFYEQLASSRHVRRKKDGLWARFHENIIKLRYRRAARLNHHNANAVIFGHTHIADRLILSPNCVYVNTGSWEPNSGGYVAVATRTGTVWGPYSIK